jgi:hypothetical protein
LPRRQRKSRQPWCADEAASAAAKARGVKLRRAELAQARTVTVATIEAAADNHVANVLPIIREIKRAGAATLREIGGGVKRARRRGGAPRMATPDILLNLLNHFQKCSHDLLRG